jgi:hypothetical protein
MRSEFSVIFDLLHSGEVESSSTQVELQILKGFLAPLGRTNVNNFLGQLRQAGLVRTLDENSAASTSAAASLTDPEIRSVQAN